MNWQVSRSSGSLFEMESLVIAREVKYPTQGVNV